MRRVLIGVLGALCGTGLVVVYPCLHPVPDLPNLIVLLVFFGIGFPWNLVVMFSPLNQLAVQIPMLCARPGAHVSQFETVVLASFAFGVLVNGFIYCYLSANHLERAVRWLRIDSSNREPKRNGE